MKKLTVTSALYLLTLNLSAQHIGGDTIGKLVAQKDNIITSSTIINIENLGININSDLPELRPTVSADGNLLILYLRKSSGKHKI